MIEIEIDASRAMARFGSDGIPLAVRNRLRQLLPDIGKQLGDLINRRLNTMLKSRTNINVPQEMHESVNEIYVRVAIEWTGDASKAQVPSWLEYGTRPHMIEAINARALSFFWPKAGGMFGTSQVFFKRVMHPGMSAYGFMSNSMAELRPEISQKLREGVVQAMKETEG